MTAEVLTEKKIIIKKDCSRAKKLNLSKTINYLAKKTKLKQNI
jgi:hypothetical protein